MCYDGTPFCGWQVQPSSPSVQGELEKALGMLLKASVGVVGAGRTDTGVSASGYTAHFDFEGQLDCKQLKYKLNAVLPKAIAVQSVSEADADFHARFSAVCRQYRYFLHRVKDPFLEASSYYYGYPDVDFDAMNKAAGMLLGTHDFCCFEKSGGDNKTSVCTVFKAEWKPYSPVLGQAGEGAVYWCFTIEADRFLRNMVRAIVGTLLEVGRGRRTLDSFSSLILEADKSAPKRPSLRSNAGESVPGHALFLTEIRYSTAGEPASE